MDEKPEYWRKCSSCKSPIAFDRIYWVCSVSTCNRVRTGLVFCSVACFDAHIPMMNHRDSGALEKRSPTLAQFLKEQAQGEEASAARTAATPVSNASAARTAATPVSNDAKQEILVVVSKTKDYVRAKSGFNTSDAVMAVLSDKIRGLLDDAIRRAAQDERKTILDRDFK